MSAFCMIVCIVAFGFPMSIVIQKKRAFSSWSAVSAVTVIVLSQPKQLDHASQSVATGARQRRPMPQSRLILLRSYFKAVYACLPSIISQLLGKTVCKHSFS
jgi:hypothetical protein